MIVLEYLICYLSLFSFSMIGMCFILYFVFKRRDRRRDIIARRKKQLEKGRRRCQRTMI